MISVNEATRGRAINPRHVIDAKFDIRMAGPLVVKYLLSVSVQNDTFHYPQPISVSHFRLPVTWHAGRRRSAPRATAAPKITNKRPIKVDR